MNYESRIGFEGGGGFVRCSVAAAATDVVAIVVVASRRSDYWSCRLLSRPENIWFTRCSSASSSSEGASSPYFPPASSDNAH